MRFSEAIEKKDIEELFKKFTGDIWQIPPIGAAVARKKRKRKIYSLHLIKIKGKDISFDVKCEAGTYIRTLAEDIGKAAGNDAKLIKLRRTQVGEFNEKDSITLQELSLAYGAWKKEGDSKRLTSIIHPIEDALTGFKKIWISNGAANAICHGAQLMVPGIAKSESGINIGDTIAIMSLDNAIIAFAEAQMSSNEMQNKSKGIAARIKRVVYHMNKSPNPPKLANFSFEESYRKL
jgi:H/ACA ribonucleoprotein complex subunit 4